MTVLTGDEIGALQFVQIVKLFARHNAKWLGTGSGLTKDTVSN
jgi:hypothetical protein